MRTRWTGIAAFAVLGVVIGVGLWWAGTLRRGPGPGASPSDEAITQALRQARGGLEMATPADTVENKSRWTPVVKGFDISDLTPARRELFVRFANAERCTCGCGYTLAACRTYDPTCPVSGPRVQSLLDSVRAGRYPGAPGARPRPSRRG